MTEYQGCSLRKLLQNRAYGVRQIEEKDNRQGKLVAAEVREVLWNAIFRDLKIFGPETSEERACPFVLHKRIHQHKI
jgi:hypothetical protein